MKTFTITFSIVGSGELSIEAESSERAEEIVFNMTTAKLIAEADFDGGLSVESIDEDV